MALGTKSILQKTSEQNLGKLVPNLLGKIVDQKLETQEIETVTEIVIAETEIAIVETEIEIEIEIATGTLIEVEAATATVSDAVHQVRA